MKRMNTQGVRISFLCITVLICGVAYSVYAMSPHGDRALQEVVQFDVILEQNYTWGRFHALMFVRYWVSADFYACSVLWMEPHGQNHMNLKTFAFMSDEKRFRIYRPDTEYYTKEYARPLGETELFTFAGGDYDIRHNRFSEREALSRRVYVQDVASVLAEQHTGVSTVAVSDISGKPKRALKRLKVQTQSGRIEDLDLLDCNDASMSRVTYEYQGDGNTLSRLTALLPETTILKGFRNKAEGLTGTVDGKPFLIESVPMPYHRGGRQCTVDYRSVPLGGREITLPDQVTVRHAQDKTVMRSVRFMNYTRMQSDPNTVYDLAREFGNYELTRRRYLTFRSQQSKRSPQEVKSDSMDQVRKYQAHFEPRFSDSSLTLGHRLIAIDALMNLDELIADWPAYERHAQAYLAFLRAQGLDQTLVFGAVAPMRVLIENRRFAGADEILQAWMKDCVSNRAYDIYRLSEYLLQGRNYWLINQLIESYLVQNRDDVAVEEAFCLRVLRCTALSGQCATVAGRAQTSDPLVRTQCDWAMSHISASLLQRKRIAALDDAQQYFTRLPASVRQEVQSPYVNLGSMRDLMGLPDPSRVHKAAAQLTGMLKAMQKQTEQRPEPNNQKPALRPRPRSSRRPGQ
ncbi:MAG: hypothetical protein K9N55_10665 [Phycisphaerae bacterium]|nr:hypothetical protein [Phycisphaerae bacterium]